MAKELKIGERIVLEITETETMDSPYLQDKNCAGCFFESKGVCEVWKKYPCAKKYRSDQKNVIFKEVKE